MGSLISVTQKVGPTVKGKKLFLGLTTEDKRKLLNIIRKDWATLIDLHFSAEGGISDDRIYPWAPLSEKHLAYKENKGYILDILQMSTPSLPKRYKDNIKTNASNFEIRMEFPTLISGAKKGVPRSASIHQTKGTNGRPRRRIILKDFKTVARKDILEFLTNE